MGGEPNRKSEVEAETKDEIQEIMNEIENLKQNIVEAPKKSNSPPVPRLQAVPPPPEALIPMEPLAADIEDVVEDVIEHIEPTEPTESTAHVAGASDTVLLRHALVGEDEGRDEELSRIAPIEAREAREAVEANGGSLSMTLSGTMTLNLKYECGDIGVSVGFVDHVFRVELSDGTEFKIPIKRAGTYRKAA